MARIRDNNGKLKQAEKKYKKKHDFGVAPSLEPRRKDGKSLSTSHRSGSGVNQKGSTSINHYLKRSNKHKKNLILLRLLKKKVVTKKSMKKKVVPRKLMNKKVTRKLVKKKVRRKLMKKEEKFKSMSNEEKFKNMSNNKARMMVQRRRKGTTCPTR
ncbi:uncharacterized protein LOC113331565 [Papaver somniferum]|uniref:uncharacterized protein LOC113331565 n=1 Tax=Papaver somniferum TaxID=3469 RepID=UPI000E6F8EEE|nr:uncharacterized protein LOC113331565 [Papaver somniferum]